MPERSLSMPMKVVCEEGQLEWTGELTRVPTHVCRVLQHTLVCIM